MVTINRWVVVEDCGLPVNPAIVEGQVRGGVAQGIGAVLLEHSAYGDDGQFLASTFMDYLMPTTLVVPNLEIHHVESVLNDPDVNFRGVGEGGMIVAPACLTNAIEDAILTAAKKYYRTEEPYQARFNQETGEIEVFLVKKVVAEVSDPSTEISLKEAKKFDPNAEIGSEIEAHKPTDVLGRIAAQTAKQVIFQKVREAERDHIFSEYGDRIGQLVTGIVKRAESGDLVVDLGKTEALLPRREQSPQTLHFLHPPCFDDGPVAELAEALGEFLPLLFFEQLNAGNLRRLNAADDRIRRLAGALDDFGKVLKKGGRLIIVEYHKNKVSMGGGRALEHIRLGVDDAIKEIQAAGWKLVSRKEFTPDVQWLAVFQKP